MAHAGRADVGLTVSEALRTPAFWIIALSLRDLLDAGHRPVLPPGRDLQERGIGSQTAAQLFPVSALTMVLAMPVFGRLLDRLPTRPMFAFAMLTMTAAMLALVTVHDAPSASLYSIVFGINNAAMHTHISYLWPRYFGRRHLGSIQGTAQTIRVVGASLGPMPLGAAFDLYGGYTGALLLLAVLPVICALAILLMRPPRLEG